MPLTFRLKYYCGLKMGHPWGFAANDRTVKPGTKQEFSGTRVLEQRAFLGSSTASDGLVGDLEVRLFS